MPERSNRTHPIKEDMRFQVRSWMLERAAWILLCILVLAALTGIGGLGPLADARTQSADQGLSVHYERFQRASLLTKFTFAHGAGAANPVRLRLSPPFQDGYEIDEITPAPTRSSAGPQGLELEFAPTPGGDLTVVMRARPRRAGLLSLAAQIEPGSSVSFSALVYP